MAAATSLAQFRVAGVVILGGSECLDEQLAACLAGIPTVVALRGSGARAFAAVTLNHASAARLAAEHLVAQRRRRIAFVAQKDDSPAAQERLRGYRGRGSLCAGGGLTASAIWLPGCR